MASRRQWFAAARPPTLPASIVPVAVGTAVARATGPVSVWRAVLCACVSLALQVGTNYANDYSDGRRGADAARVGPTRLVAAGLASPAAVRRAAVAAFCVAGACGLALAVSTSYWLLAVGAASIAAGALYTGGPRPYGYAGLGEVFVFVFFGGVAVVGTTYAETRLFPAGAFLAAVPVGLLSVALLVVNNLRDIPGDAAAGKRTLAVRMGEGRTRVLYAGLCAAALVSSLAMVPLRNAAAIGAAALVVCLVPLRRVRSGARGRELIPALVWTGRAQLLFGALFAIGIAL